MPTLEDIKRENVYRKETLISNWYEEQSDLKYVKGKRHSLPTEGNHYFETTYKVAYSKQPAGLNSNVSTLRYITSRMPLAFPSHQPEFDPAALAKDAADWRTEHQRAFTDNTQWIVETKRERRRKIIEKRAATEAGSA